MKKIILTTHEPQSESVEYIFKEHQIPFYKKEISSEDIDLLEYTALSPDDPTRTILEKLNKILDTRQKDITITSQTLDASFSDYLKNLQDQETAKKKGKLTEEFAAITEPSVDFNKDLLYMICIATAVALVGLFTNNPAIVIGAMLLSPLLGPVTAFSFNVSIAKPEKMAKAALSGFILTIAIIATAAALTGITLLFTDVPITNEIILRTELSPIVLGLAIVLGLGGGIAMSSDIPELLVGVAIAAALVPPAAVTGIGIAMWDFEMFSSALILVTANIIGLVLGTMIIFFAKGITPRKYYQKEKGKKYTLVTIAIFIGLSIFVFFLTF